MQAGHSITVLLALRGLVEHELARLEADVTIYRIDYSDYGTPIVPVVKQNACAGIIKLP